MKNKLSTEEKTMTPSLDQDSLTTQPTPPYGVADHTKLKLKVEDANIRDAHQALVAQVCCVQDAAHIVNCVNERKELLETIRWVAQTVHQAYHESGTFMTCSKNPCYTAKQVLVQAEAQP